MFLDLSHPEKNSTKFGMVQLDFSRKVDFLISLLALAGIRFSPFDSHVSPITIDSITLDEWRSWLNQTIAKSDPRWYWRVDDIASSVQKEVETCRQMIPPEHLENLDWSAIRAIYINRTTWLDEQYRQVAQEYSTPLQDEIEESWMEDTKMITTDNSTGDLRIGSSPYIDFALWILVQDGLQVAPFDNHTGGNQILQSLGMTRESWYKWLKLILIHHDNRLGWHVSNIDAEVKENVESFKKMIGIMSKAQDIEDNTVYDQQWYDSQVSKVAEPFILANRGGSG